MPDTQLNFDSCLGNKYVNGMFSMIMGVGREKNDSSSSLWRIGEK